MLSDKKVVCPLNLLEKASKKKGIKAAIVNAGKPLPMLSVFDSVNEGLIDPVFIGNKEEIEKGHLANREILVEQGVVVLETQQEMDLWQYQ